MSQASEAIKQQRDYSDPKLRAQALQGSNFGPEDMARYDKLAGRSPAGEQETPSSTPSQKSTPAPAIETGNISINTGSRSGAKEKASSYKKFGGGQQNVQQDNDQTSSIVGNNNYVNQNQDNSVRNYGGDKRVFNYQGSGNPMTDTPASMATMAGFFAPDDSHSANAARLDRQSTQNRDLQKAYQNTSHIAQGAISRANQNAYTDPAALDKRIAQREQYNNAKSDVMRSHLFGDMGNFQADAWKDAKPREEVEMPDYDEMYEKYSKF